jgi:hypothetical protein
VPFSAFGNTGLSVSRLAFGATFTAGNRDLAGLYKVDADLADDAATKPIAVYPNWFMENLTDPQAAEALGWQMRTARP